MGNQCLRKLQSPRRHEPSNQMPDSISNHDESTIMSEEPEAKPIHRGRRQAVAAESYDPTADDDTNSTEIIVHEKTEEQLQCLKDAAEGIVFFKNCDEEQKKILFDAMFEKKVIKGDIIIKQGDDGDNFYVIEKGEYEVIIEQKGEEKVVAILKNKGFFGELALLYNCPRNATIKSAGNGVLWGLDQTTFRKIVVKATAKKRQMFEDLLKGVSMLDSLTTYELMNLTDALDTHNYKKNDVIIKEGAEADNMYFIMNGEVLVSALNNETNEEKIITKLDRGKYFGELALVLQKPRVATVKANSENVKVAVLNINAFERLLGPCVDIMKRNIEAYEQERERLGLHAISTPGR